MLELQKLKRYLYIKQSELLRLKLELLTFESELLMLEPELRSFKPKLLMFKSGLCSNLDLLQWCECCYAGLRSVLASDEQCYCWGSALLATKLIGSKSECFH